MEKFDDNDISLINKDSEYDRMNESDYQIHNDIERSLSHNSKTCNSKDMLSSGNLYLRYRDSESRTPHMNSGIDTNYVTFGAAQKGRITSDNNILATRKYESTNYRTNDRTESENKQLIENVDKISNKTSENR